MARVARWEAGRVAGRGWATKDLPQVGHQPDGSQRPLYNHRSLDDALCFGYRGVPGGDSLAKLLGCERGHRHVHRLPSLTGDSILAWHADRGTWPNENSDPILGIRDEVWPNVNTALTLGKQGLTGGNSLAPLLGRHLGVRCNRPPLALLFLLLRFPGVVSR
jgi:hypothetical protein